MQRARATRRVQVVAHEVVHPLGLRAGEREVGVAVAVVVVPLHAVIGLERLERHRRHVLEARPRVAQEVVAVRLPPGHRPVHVQIDAAVVVEVGERTAVEVGVDVGAPRRAHVLEASVAAIEEESIPSIVGGDEVEATVLVHVGGAGTHRPLLLVPGRAPAPDDAGRLGDVGEVIAVVAPERIGVAVHVPLVEIQVAVVVHVEPDAADALAGVGNA